MFGFYVGTYDVTAQGSLKGKIYYLKLNLQNQQLLCCTLNMWSVNT